MTRTSSNRRRRHERSTLASYAIATAVVVAAAGMLFIGATAQRGVPGVKHYRIDAEFAHAANLSHYAEVRIAGKRVGQVLDITERGGISRARLQLDTDVRPLRNGTTARIRLKGLLGAKFVELRPAAHGAALADGATIPVSRTSTSVELFDVFEALDKRRRDELGDLLRGLGAGFLGRGNQLHAGLRAFPTGLRSLGAVARTVNARPGAAARLFPSVDAAAAPFDRERADIAATFGPAARAMAPFAQERSNVERALTTAPPALASVQDGLRRTDPLLRATTRLARAAVSLTRPAPRALRQTAALLRESPHPLVLTRTLLQRAAAAVPATLRLTRTLDPLIHPVRQALTTGLPLMHEADRYGCDLLGFARNWRSMLAYGVPSDNPIGPVTGLRVEAVASDEAIGDRPALHPRSVGYRAPCAFGPLPAPGSAR